MAMAARGTAAVDVLRLVALIHKHLDHFIRVGICFQLLLYAHKRQVGHHQLLDPSCRAWYCCWN